MNPTCDVISVSCYQYCQKEPEDKEEKQKTGRKRVTSRKGRSWGKSWAGALTKQGHPEEPVSAKRRTAPYRAETIGRREGNQAESLQLRELRGVCGKCVCPLCHPLELQSPACCDLWKCPLAA